MTLAPNSDLVKDTPPTQYYTFTLHDALPIFGIKLSTSVSVPPVIWLCPLPLKTGKPTTVKAAVHRFIPVPSVVMNCRPTLPPPEKAIVPLCASTVPVLVKGRQMEGVPAHALL